MKSKKFVCIIAILCLIFSVFIAQKSYAVTKIEENQTTENTTASNEIQEEQKNEETAQNEEKTEDEPIIKMNENTEPIVGSASGSGYQVGNEREFSSAFYNTGIGEITTTSNIRLNSPYTVKHTMRIDTSSTAGNNALQLSSGCYITVSSGCVLTLDQMVIDGRSFGNNDDKSCITVKSGGVLMLIGHSIIDGGMKNWGINVESGGQLLIVSCQVSYCNRGIVLQGTSQCDLASSEAVNWWGNDNMSVDITNNNTGIYCGGNYRGSLVVNHTSQNNEKINFETNTYGIEIESHSGSITIAHARMANNEWAINTQGNLTINSVNAAYNAKGIVNNGGTVNFKGGDFYSDASSIKEHGIYNISGTVNMSGGTIKNNSSYGIYNEASSNITGQVYMTGGTVTGNTKYDIYHAKSDSDGAGAMYGGLRIERNDTISSKIFLAARDNYVYTGSNTPTITSITLAYNPIERKVIRSADNAKASVMENKITVTNPGSFYCKANATGNPHLIVLWADYTVTTYYKTLDGRTLDTDTQTVSYKDSYTTAPKTIEGYQLSSTPSNSSGTINGNTTVTYYYEEVQDDNVAVVKYQDLLSGVTSAKYWYNSSSNSFSGSGTSFSNGAVFEDYGCYKVIITNGVGLSKKLTFVSNEDSV